VVVGAVGDDAGGGGFGEKRGAGGKVLLKGGKREGIWVVVWGSLEAGGRRRVVGDARASGVGVTSDGVGDAFHRDTC
jgi:hypothetical protein